MPRLILSTRDNSLWPIANEAPEGMEIEERRRLQAYKLRFAPSHFGIVTSPIIDRLFVAVTGTNASRAPFLLQPIDSVPVTEQVTAFRELD